MLQETVPHRVDAQGSSVLVPEAPLWHLEGQAFPMCLNLYSRHTSSHCGTWYPLACYLRTSPLPETSVSCFLSLPITLEGWPGPRTATPLPPMPFRDFQQTFSLPLPDFSHTNNKRWFLKQNLELSNAQAGMGVLQSGKAL